MQQATPRPAAVSTQGGATTRTQLEALHAQRAELRVQLQTLTARRRELDGQRDRLVGDQRRDHDLRIQAIDQRSTAVERDLLHVDETIARAMSQGIAEDQTAPALEQGLDRAPETSTAVEPLVRDTVIGLSAGAGALSVLTAFLLFRGIRRIFRKPRADPAVDHGARLDRLQQSVDVIAVEVERISEAQRFVARMLGEKLPALGDGEAQPIVGKAKEPAPAARR
jgi:hypothetical protein